MNVYPNLLAISPSDIRVVNQDGEVDGSDEALINIDASNFATGYLVSDLNRDEVIDGIDAAIADNNAANFVSVART